MTGLLTWAYVVATGSVLDPLYTALGWVMAWLYALVPSYGIAIILLTVAVRLVLYPLTVKQTKSMQAMQRLQPEIKRLQTKYKNDRQKLNEEMMKFYKENKVNPLSGCLPLLLQLPLFIVLYRLIHDLTTTVITGAVIAGSFTTAGNLPPTVTFQNVKISNGTITSVKASGSTPAHDKLSDSITADVVGPDGKIIGQLQGVVGQFTKGPDNVVSKSKTDDKAPVVDLTTKNHNVVGTISGAVVAVGPDGAHVTANPKHIPKDSQLAKDLEKTPGHMNWLGMDLAKRPSQGQGAELVGMYLLVALTVVTGYYQQRQMTNRTPASAQNQQMQMMGKIFPLFFGFIALQVPAGVVLYFVVSNLWQIGQQAIIFRQQDAADAAKKAGGGGKGGGGSAIQAKSTPATPAAPVVPAAPAKTKTGNSQPPKGGPSNPSNRSRRRRRRRKGR
ncbi:MAG: YidC/Oxa1 family membrane protein insertase [Acidimicrobiia bacterium]|nr:YidC/Oxa1 family membrane protein insertase [Acidimicrobiia bacterium]